MDTASSSAPAGGVEISVVTPVYGCRACLPDLHRRLQASLGSITSRYEIVFVEDCSPDGAWEALVPIAQGDRRVRALRLSRNFGQHAAITAGLSQASGRWVVVMDCDLQDPPEDIPRLYRTAQQGYDVVFTRRQQRQHGWWRRLAARAYFRLLQLATGTPTDERHGSFTILSRKVVDAFLRFKDRDRHYLYILYWLGFRSTAIDYQHAERASGRSSYTLRALLRHAADGVFAQTTAILRWIVYCGFGVSALGLLLALYFLYRYVVYSVQQPGWTSLAVLNLVIGGMIIFTTGVAGLYVGKIFEQVKERPLFVIDKSIGGDPEG